MRLILTAVLLSISCLVFAGNDGYKKEIIKIYQMKESVFSYDGIRLYDSINNVQKTLKNCKRIDSDNWNYQCNDKKTYLFAIKGGEISRFRVIEKLSHDEIIKKVEGISNIYGPPNIITRNVIRPSFSVGNYSTDGTKALEWNASEPDSYTWYEKKELNCCSDGPLEKFYGVEITIKKWFGSMMLTVTNRDIQFYEKHQSLDYDNLILSNKTSAMLGLKYAFGGLIFLLLVLFYRNAFEDIGNRGFKEAIRSYFFLLPATLLLVVFFAWIRYLIDLDFLGLMVAFAIAAFSGIYMAYKKI